MRKLYYLPLCLAVVALSACNENAESSDAREERDPLVKTGQAYMEQQLWNEAEQTFKEALDNDPMMARPHLDLALIYQQYKPNYIHSIYHYDRYLELRPESEKAEFINEQKVKLQQAVANNIIKESPQVKQVLDELNRLRQENASLKKQLADDSTAAKSTSAVSADQPSPTTAVASTANQPAQNTETHQIYHVVAGDTLTKIATKFYGDSAKWDVIFEANKAALPSPSDLRVGQTLVIPAAGQ
jgi:nucleoid-associated protein YgaU